MSSLERAIEMASAAHAGQVDKCGEPYILHALRVMFGVSGEVSQIVAALHDVVEDTEIGLDDIALSGFAPEVVAAIDALTRREHEDYYVYINRVARNPIAIMVKLADLKDNLDPNRISDTDPNGPGRRIRYRKAQRILLEKAAQ